MIEPQPPAQLNPNPLMPAGPDPLLMEFWEGINTSTLRPGVPDKQCYWIEGFMPLAPRNLRTLYGIGTAIYTNNNQVIALFGFYNLGSTPYCAVFLSNGLVVQVNTNTLATTTILAAGTIMGPTSASVGMCQYGNSYLIIVANGAGNANGYWVWDGTSAYTAGTLSPIITITNVGSGYSTPPLVAVSGGTGSGVVLTASVANGVVTAVTVVNPGSGYSAGDTVTVSFGAPSTGASGAATAVLTQSPGGSGGVLTPNMASTTIQSVTITNGGSGYSQFVTLSTSGGGAKPKPAVLTATVTNGVISAVTVSEGGVYSSTPTIVITDPGYYSVTSVTVTNGGSGYSPSTTVTASGGGAPVTQATLRPVISGGVITSVTVLSGGNYGSNTPPTLAVTDTGVTATATAALMPFAISGSTVETYSGHVWVANGGTVYGSATGSFSNFAIASGGVQFTSQDSFLRVNYTRLVNANGFLWLVGDSSLSYISGVTTTGGVTTYTLQNADPEVGSPWPWSVNTFGRYVVLANFWGVHEGQGSSVQKISDALDGVYNSVLTRLSPWQTSSAKAIIFDRKVLMFLMPIVNPITSATVNQLMMWDGKRWFVSLQDVSLTFIASQEINSQLTAYGTDSHSIYPLFNQPSASVTKYVQSRLWDVGGYWFVNATTRFWAMFQYYSNAYSTVTISIDDEYGSTNSQSVDVSLTQTVTWTNNSNATVTWTNNSAATVTWYLMGSGITVVQPTAVAQQGVLAGFTLSTSDPDMAIISAALKPEIVQYRG